MWNSIYVEYPPWANPRRPETDSGCQSLCSSTVPVCTPVKPSPRPQGICFTPSLYSVLTSGGAGNASVLPVSLGSTRPPRPGRMGHCLGPQNPHFPTGLQGPASHRCGAHTFHETGCHSDLDPFPRLSIWESRLPRPSSWMTSDWLKALGHSSKVTLRK